MGFERRLFARTDVEVFGELQWQLKRRVGPAKTRTAPIQTVDLSVDGARVLVHRTVSLPIGASVRIVFDEHSSPARVRQVLKNEEDRDNQMLRLQLENPPDGFMRIIDQWLDANKGGRKFKERNWIEEAVPDELYRSTG